MAKKIKGSLEPMKRGRTPMYPWEDWLDGSAWELRQGEDYKVADSSFRNAAYSAARQRGMALVSVVPRMGVVQIQARRNGK